jgi:Ankyrin repeats (3 copies)
MFFAAFYGNVDTLEQLRLLNTNINGRDHDGRTAIGVAASQGKLEAVKYLIARGADVMIVDLRGNMPQDDSERGHYNNINDYIINEALIKVICDQYENGLFAKGIASSIGIFHRKFADLLIAVNNPQASGIPTTQFLMGSQLLTADGTSQSTIRILSVLISA